MNIHFKPALECSNRATLLLAAQIRKHRALLKIVRAALPAALARQVSDCALSGRKLLLYTASAVWASQLRFHSGTILEAVNTLAEESVDVVLTRILPPLAEQQIPARKAKLPPAAYIEELRSIAGTVADDSLKQALGRLGATLKRLYEAEDCN